MIQSRVTGMVLPHHQTFVAQHGGDLGAPSARDTIGMGRRPGQTSSSQVVEQRKAERDRIESAIS